MTQPYIGRFAPSPSGQLHLGSLVTAMASYLDAKSHQGKWLLRIDDIDSPREKTGSTLQIIKTLAEFGFKWDSIYYQQQHKKHYQKALNSLINDQQIYACDCTRKQLKETSSQGLGESIYPNHCKDKKIPLHTHNTALRVTTTPQEICFSDIINGSFVQNMQNEVGDFILKRKDGIFSYQLAVCVDDELQRITHIIRGADLLTSTPRQIYLQNLLGYSTKQYLHIPLILNTDGSKLSKQSEDLAINSETALQVLLNAHQLLGQKPLSNVTSIQQFWLQAISHWDYQKIPTSSVIKLRKSKSA